MGLVDSVTAKNKEYKEKLENEAKKVEQEESETIDVAGILEDEAAFKKEREMKAQKEKEQPRGIGFYPEERERLERAFKNMKRLQDELSKMGEIVEEIQETRGSGDGVADKMTDALDWDLLSRMTDTFCSVMETPNLARKLTNDTYTYLVKNQVSFFEEVNARYWGKGKIKRTWKK